MKNGLNIKTGSVHDQPKDDPSIRIVKVLLLGTGESGKSTIVKQVSSTLSASNTSGENCRQIILKSRGAQMLSSEQNKENKFTRPLAKKYTNHKILA